MSLDEVTSTYVREAARRLRDALQDDLFGVYILGSGSMGGFDPRTSDVDLAAVVTGTLTEDQKREVVERLSHTALPCPVRKLELVVYRPEALEGSSPSLRWELNLNTGREIGTEASFDPSAEPEHWFLLDVAMAREHSSPVLGPPPGMVFGAIGRDRVVRALIGSIRWHRSNDREGIQSVLNASRAWRWVEEGVWSPKPAAARWARARAEDPGVIDAALAARAAGGTSSLENNAVERFVTSVEQRVERALEGA